jgi:transcriptional regulator with XRE-family HTH domain
MSDDKRRARPAAQYGPTAETVAQNVKRLREARGLTIYALSAALGKAGRPITPSAIAKVERQQRQVTVDDLTALAVVLKVSPSALFLPLKDGPAETVEVTGAGSVSAQDAWEWADGAKPLNFTFELDQTELLEFELYSRPPGRRAMWNAGRELYLKGESRNADIVRRLDRERTEGGNDGSRLD